MHSAGSGMHADAVDRMSSLDAGWTQRSYVQNGFELGFEISARKESSLVTLSSQYVQNYCRYDKTDHSVNQKMQNRVSCNSSAQIGIAQIHRSFTKLNRIALMLPPSSLAFGETEKWNRCDAQIFISYASDLLDEGLKNWATRINVSHSGIENKTIRKQ